MSICANQNSREPFHLFICCSACVLNWEADRTSRLKLSGCRDCRSGISWRSKSSSNVKAKKYSLAKQEKTKEMVTRTRLPAGGMKTWGRPRGCPPPTHPQKHTDTQSRHKHWINTQLDTDRVRQLQTDARRRNVHTLWSFKINYSVDSKYLQFTKYTCRFLLFTSSFDRINTHSDS